MGCLTGGNLDNQGFGKLTLANTIVAHARSGGDVTRSGEPGETLTLLGVNLVEDGSVTGPGVITADPLLGPSGNYGGPTQTMPLLPGSPAIDAGTATGGPSTDQCGFGRVGPVDIGAYESGNASR